jgi:hypothetical protein
MNGGTGPLPASTPQVARYFTPRQVGDMSDPLQPSRIEDLYRRYRDAGGQRQQLDLDVSAKEIGAAFEATAAATRGLSGTGPFHPPGKRKALFDLNKERLLADPLCDTQHLQALLWSPPRWSVEGRPELDFLFVAREISPGSALDRKGRAWVIERDRHVSADLLLMNTTDRTPIVAEFKRGGDQNADYALVQALAAAAQLTPPWQRERLREEYADHFGTDVPERLDVYVIVADPPPRGTRPELLERALTHAADLTGSGQLDRWIRRIAFLEAEATNGELTFKVLDGQMSERD